MDEVCVWRREKGMSWCVCVCMYSIDDVFPCSAFASACRCLSAPLTALSSCSAKELWVACTPFLIVAPHEWCTQPRAHSVSLGHCNLWPFASRWSILPCNGETPGIFCVWWTPHSLCGRSHNQWSSIWGTACNEALPYHTVVYDSLQSQSLNPTWWPLAKLAKLLV